MNIQTLDKIIAKFWDSKRNDTRYYMGYCSEFAVALQRFLKSGRTAKHGLWHTVLEYKKHYCDVRGCHTPSDMYVVSPTPEKTRPANDSEIKHIYSLLHEDIVQDIVNGLKKAKVEVAG